MTGNDFKKRFALLAPSWIFTQLARGKAPINTLLNLPALLQIFSLEDVATMYCLNTEEQYTTTVFGPGLIANHGLCKYWAQRFPAQLDKVLEVAELYRDAATQRLFIQAPLEVSKDLAPIFHRVESEDAQCEVIAIVLKPGFLGGAELRETQQLLVREYIRQSYAFTDFATLSCDPLFERYLKSVAADEVSEPA